MIEQNGCEKCRRAGVKLFLKGERCNSQNCAMIKKPYSPGQKGKKRKGPPSEYGRELAEKQKLRFWYNLQEKQFSKYVRSIIKKRKKDVSAANQLLGRLESRLDNMVFRAGFAVSRVQARQMVNHGFFLVNDKPVDIPSYETKVGDVISVRPGKKKKKVFEDWSARVKNYTPPSWISLDKKKMEAKVKGDVIIDDVLPPVEISSVFEFYSR